MKRLNFSLVLGLFLILSLSFVSAGWFGDLFNKKDVTGNVAIDGWTDLDNNVGIQNFGESTDGDTCIDTDGGDKPFIYGTVNGIGDVCLDANSLSENYCLGGESVSIVYFCENGCDLDNNVCIQNISNIEVSVATLKDQYIVGKQIKLTDPPEEEINKIITGNVIKEEEVNNLIKKEFELRTFNSNSVKEYSQELEFENFLKYQNYFSLNKQNKDFMNFYPKENSYSIYDVFDSDDFLEKEFEGYLIEFEEEPIIIEKIRLDEKANNNMKKIEESLSFFKFFNKFFLFIPEEVEVKLEDYSENLEKENIKIKQRISSELYGDYRNSKSLEIKEEFNIAFNGILLNITKEEAKKIKNVKGVKSISPNYEVYATLMDSAPLINANDVWQIPDFHNSSLNLTGEGITIAIIDTGIDYTHEDLGNCTQTEFLSGNCDKVVGGYDFVNEDNNPMDDHGHGTHCAATATGKGVLKGIAPDAKLYGFKVLSSGGSGFLDDVIFAIERSIDLDNDGNIMEDKNDYVDIISLSLGGSGNPDDSSSRAIDNVVNAGIVAVVAAGNAGCENCIGSPGTSRKAITVAASNKTDVIAKFSSRGPVVWENKQGKIKSLVKPDVTAPGVNICAAQWADAWQDSECLDTQHTSISGTSMATPHVAGAVALIKQAHPNWTPDEIKYALRNTAIDISENFITQGQGRIDILEGVNYESLLIAEFSPISYFPSGQIDIYGTAKGQNFSNYKVYYSVRDSENWNLICQGNNEVENNILCEDFDTSYLIDAEYDLKLIVYSFGGEEGEDYGAFKINNLKIVNPLNNDIYKLGDVVDIQIEVLNSANFYSVEVKYENGSSLGSTGINIINNTFATWDTSKLIEGFYDLTLTFELKGSYIKETIQNIQLDSNFRETIIIDPLISNNGIYSDLRVADLNGDGLKEIALKGFQEVVIYKQDGSLMPGWPKRVNNTRIIFYPYSYAPLTIGDVNNDGKKEIFSSWKQYSTGTSSASIDDGYCLHGWNYDGSLFPNFPLRCSDNYLGSPWSPIILSDINDDDFLELILGVIDQTESNFKIFVFNHQGQLMTGWPVEINFVENRNFYIPLAVEDLDNDGKKEILFSSNDRTLIFDYQGNLKKIFPIAMTAGMSIGDLTGDGKLDILKRYNSWLGLFNFEGVVPEWGTRFFYSYGSVLTPGYSISSGSLGDLNNDGVPEIVIGSSFFRDSGKPDPDYQDKIYIFEANGSILNYWNISDIDFYKEIGAQPVIADITNDGKQDIIANVLGLEGNQLYAWNSDGSIIRGFPKNLGAFSSSYNSPVIDDIDNDGNLEILVYVFKFIEDVNMPGNYIPLNKILVFDLDTIYNPKKMDWPMYMHDVKNTNCYKCDNVSIIPLRPQSKVVNNNDFEVTGNLIMKLQKKVNDKWMDEQIVTNTDVIIAPNNLIKLDIGEDYGWNLKNVNAKSYGDYRIYVSFEVDNQKQEAFWEFKVIASKKIEKISNFPKISSFK